ncbi:MAG: hypothetical protein CVV27_03190 [Candidatus Melainabacteria bacterium HGW-Melainabacteria-1]|nr:MAG: hypothetical protein CVV27_03190 [Candidatus Melainabacteria bacterium HGW-Melainabacteria-1]
MVSVYQPPHEVPDHPGLPSVFLAGSIDMGRAAAWQKQVEAVLANEDVVLLNPRRDDWDASWIQSMHHPEFRRQVEWEIEGLERADYILMYFVPETTAPVSLLELGLFARSGKMLVACPSAYWRRGNVELICERFGIPLFHHLESALLTLRNRLKEWQP